MNIDEHTNTPLEDELFDSPLDEETVFDDDELGVYAMDEEDEGVGFDDFDDIDE